MFQLSDLFQCGLFPLSKKGLFREDDWLPFKTTLPLLYLKAFKIDEREYEEEKKEKEEEGDEI
jgi:hypothetical protein